jgi:hypothetical protein
MTQATPASTDPCSILMSLGLSLAEVDCLKDQGVVTAEYRDYQGTHLGPYHKLRWRMHGRQRVKYLGQDLAKAERVSIALAQLRQQKVLDRQLAKMMSEARKGLRKAKKELAAAMTARGRYYHGYTSRKQRCSAIGAGN